jgi:hypothetical protein
MTTQKFKVGDTVIIPKHETPLFRGKTHVILEAVKGVYLLSEETHLFVDSDLQSSVVLSPAQIVEEMIDVTLSVGSRPLTGPMLTRYNTLKEVGDRIAASNMAQAQIAAYQGWIDAR